MDNIKIGISGLGFVGSALLKSFELKGYTINNTLIVYDKYKDNGIGKFDDLINTNILFLCLPTQFNTNSKSYDIDSIKETLELLHNSLFHGVVVIKSTIEPGTTNILANKYNLDIVHNPEFLTARTAFIDFHNQKHIVLGKSSNCDDNKLMLVKNFYKLHYPDAILSLCSSSESECMKIFLNSFYAIKVQYFTEIYLLCNKLGIEYNNVKDLMLKNGWITPMHTTIPGPDGSISYGGLCFPKDTSALLYFMENLDVPHSVLEATITERNNMRNDDNQNII
jgi:UDPglucose 6-dehydrogenase